MTGFLIGALLIVGAALGVLLWPLWRRPASAEFSRKQLNAAIYRDQFAELDRDRNEGVLSQADYDQAKAELQRRLLEDSQAEPATASRGGPQGRRLPLVLAIVLPLATILLYALLGTPAALNPLARQQQFSQDDIDRMVSGLAAKLENEPQNYPGWAMLGRSYKSMGRFPEAVRAYERTGPLLDSSADLLVDYADALAASERGFTDKVNALIDKALRLDPANLQGLWMRGTAAFEAKNYAQAVTDWEKLRTLLEPGSEDERVVAGNIEEARGKGGLKAPSAQGKVAPAASIRGQVDLATAMRSKIPPGASLMVVARPNDGSRMPVAVLRVPIDQWPRTFTLDDSQSMSPERKLSQVPEVLLEARISQSGQAVPQPGDLFGPATAVKPGSTGVKLKIDQVR